LLTAAAQEPQVHLQALDKNPFKFFKNQNSAAAQLLRITSFSISLSITFTDSPHHVETEKIYPFTCSTARHSSPLVANSSSTRHLPVTNRSSLLLLFLFLLLTHYSLIFTFTLFLFRFGIFEA
jgi:hypothetical protein